MNLSVAPAVAHSRREQLRRRCDAQRLQLGNAVAHVQQQLQGLDRGLLMVRRLRVGPALVALGTAAVATLPMFRYVNRALLVVRALRALKGLRPAR